MIVLFGGQKGGTGKSTLAQNVAVWMAKNELDVMLLDTDTQCTVSRWHDRRVERHDKLVEQGSEGLALVHCTQTTGMVHATARDLDNRYDVVVIDAGGRDSTELRSSMSVADKLFVPMKASQPDLETTAHMSEVVSLSKAHNPDMQAFGLLSMAPTNPMLSEAEQARDALCELGMDIQPIEDVFIHDRKVYRDAMIEGFGVMEMNNEKAKKELNNLCRSYIIV